MGKPRVSSGSPCRAWSVMEEFRNNRGLTWSRDEILCFLDIWAEHFTGAQMSTRHQNRHIYNTFSRMLSGKGYPRTLEQCRVKAKSLRAQFLRVRAALKQPGGGSERLKFPWYDHMQRLMEGGAGGGAGKVQVVIVGDPQDQDPQDPPLSSHWTAPLHEDASVLESSPSHSGGAEGEDGGGEGEESSPGLVCKEEKEEKEEALSLGGRPPLPAAPARRRRRRSGLTQQDLSEYMAATRRMMEDLDQAEERRLAREDARMERIMQAQRMESDQRLQVLMEQQQANTLALMQVITKLFPPHPHAPPTAAPPPPQDPAPSPQTQAPAPQKSTSASAPQTQDSAPPPREWALPPPPAPPMDPPTAAQPRPQSQISAPSLEAYYHF